MTGVTFYPFTGTCHSLLARAIKFEMH